MMLVFLLVWYGVPILSVAREETEWTEAILFLIVGIMALKRKNLYNFHAFVRSMLE